LQPIIEDPAGTAAGIKDVVIDTAEKAAAGDRKAIGQIAATITSAFTGKPNLNVGAKAAAIGNGIRTTVQTMTRKVRDIATRMVPSNGIKVPESLKLFVPKLRYNAVPDGAGSRGGSSVGPNSVNSVAARRAYLNEKFGRTGDLNTDINVRGYLNEVERIDVSSGYGDAIFYSGPGNRARAEAFSKSGGTTLESTLGGAWLNNQVLFKRLAPEQAILPWERLSQRFAQEASGPVNVFIDGANARGVFSRIELPALYENPHVALIIKNGVQPIRIK
jgi:hypothetical protein